MRHKLSSRPCDLEDFFVTTVCSPLYCLLASLFVFLAVCASPRTSEHTTMFLQSKPGLGLIVTCLPFDISIADKS